MKRKLFLTLSTVLFGVLANVTNAQEQELKYRRSSLSMILIESESFPNKEAVMSSWDNYPFPNQYNQHEISTKSFNPNNIELTDSELLAAGFLDTLRSVLDFTKAVAKPVRYLDSAKTEAVVLPTEKEEYQMKIDKVIAENKLANQVVSSWFNLGEDGEFDMSIIQERGFYNASELEADVAKGQTRGMAALGDAGEELIKNTFLTFTKLDFVENEPIARSIRDAAILAATTSEMPEIAVKAAILAADKAYEVAKEGYSLWSKTWLYQLNWNDSTANIFYNDYYSNPSAFNNSDLFKLDFVGVQFNQSLVTFKIGEKRTLEQIVDLALVRNIDNAFAKLQKENDVFKPKTPIISVDPIIVQIGEKEGVDKKSSFEVLEMVLDRKTQKTEWKVIGNCKVDTKKPIWNNLYNAGKKVETQRDDAGNEVIGTTLKGSKQIQPGMLVKIIK